MTTPQSPKVPETEKTTEFTPPRHWVGPEQLEADYWNDPKTAEKRGQEFYEKPIELIDFIDKIDEKGIARRDFLTVMGASMAMASLACARRPVHKIIPYVVQPEYIVPGVPNWYASTCKGCGVGCGVLVKNREGRPIKLEGNPDHPVNRGKLCARGQASLLDLYDTDRLTTPVARSREGGRREISWQEADAAILSKLRSVASSGGRVRLLTGEISGDTTRRLAHDFLAAFHDGEHVEYEALAHEEIAAGQTASYGTAVIPQYHFDRAEAVLSIGADFLAGWLSPVEYAVDWAKNRRLEGGKLSKFMIFEPTMTNTGASSDERHGIRPGDELKVAMAVAHALIVEGKRSRYAGDGAVAIALSSYSPEAVGQEIGLDPKVFRETAEALWGARGKGLVVAGGAASRTKDAVAVQVAVNLLNSALENEGVTVDAAGGVPARSNFAAVSKLVADMKAGKVDVLIVQGTNPAFTLPKNTGGAGGLQEAFRKVPLVISIAEREDETSLWADFVLPEHHYLENWGDSNPRKGVVSLQQPALAPLHNTRAFEDTLLAWVKGSGGHTSSLAASSADWHGYLMGAWRETTYREHGGSAPFEQFWEGSLRVGALGKEGGSRGARPLRTESVARLPKLAKLANSAKSAMDASAGEGVLMALYEKISMYDGRQANNAWLQEMPDSVSSVTWDNHLNVGPALAKKLGLKQDDVVEVRAGDVSAQLPVYVQPGMHPQAVSVAVGYGRRSVGKVGNLAGVDVFPFVNVEGDRPVFSGFSVELQKTGRVYPLATTQWHTVSENRPVINDVTLAEYQRNPRAANETNPELRPEKMESLWPLHEYKGYRWGLAVDLNACTGCGACIIGCQAENNIPVVGRDQVRNSRQMHWIRIDRYYTGSADAPDVVFQPMMCQQCENAPCETVCPVLATVHDDEGLNVQVYNRCVGTRYCQNNCPYKVRRFNFFDHWKNYEGTMNLVWNPDVTVRTRGIMEKCTFCVQRIRDAKDHAKDENSKVRDGDVKTACQQTCPTDAIVFGDVNDPTSRVSKLRADQRAFRVIETLNTKPMVSYMSRVRNKPEKV